MISNLSIDVVIPSYRLQYDYLKEIIGLECPLNIQVKYYIIADNPAISIDKTIIDLVKKPNITLIKNKENIGAANSRNKGIDAGTGDWVLFLDDDVKPQKDLLKVYVNAINTYSNFDGFFGETVFPKPINSFTNGIKVGGMLYFFEYAGFSDEAKCATTSNVLIKRKAIGNVRFRSEFPKKGGGEDFAFFLEIFNSTNKKLKAINNAKVYHNWWNNGKRSYKQFYRWGNADNLVFKYFPEITYIDFPNISEALFIGLIAGLVAIILGNTWLLFILLLGIVVGEFIGEGLSLARGQGIRGLRYFHEVVIIRASVDFGRLIGLIKSHQWHQILKRPNYSNHKVDHYFYKRSILKFFCYIIFIVIGKQLL